MKKAYCIVQILEVNDPAKFSEYVSGHLPSITKFGGKFIVKGSEGEVLEGKWDGIRIVIHEFPCKQQLLDWYDSDDYKPWKHLRQSCSTVNVVITEGV